MLVERGERERERKYVSKYGIDLPEGGEASRVLPLLGIPADWNYRGDSTSLVYAVVYPYLVSVQEYPDR